jgi:hypothetical protein
MGYVSCSWDYEVSWLTAVEGVMELASMREDSLCLSEFQLLSEVK